MHGLSARTRQLLPALGLLASFLAALGPLQALPPVPARTAQREQLTPDPAIEAPPFANLPPPPGTACPVDPPPPTVTVGVRVAAVGSSGQELAYRIRVSNRSRAAAHHVTVHNPVPAHAGYVRATPEPAARAPELVWHLGTLPPCGCREIVLVLRPTGTGDIRNCVRVQIEHGQCVTTRIARTGGAVPVVAPPVVPGLSVRKTGPARAKLFDALSFRVEVANTGSVPLANVVLTDVLPAGLDYLQGEAQPPPDAPREGAKVPRTLLTWNLGTLTAGQHRTIEYRASAKKEGTFTNRAMVTAAGGRRQESSSRVTVGEARLTMTMTGPESRYANHPADYELTVSNTGSVAATNVEVSNPLPAGARVLALPAGGQQLGAEVKWLLGTLPPGARKKLRLRLGVEKAGEMVNRATVKADRALKASAEVKTRFEGKAGLSARIDKSADPVEVGMEVRYLVTVENTGSADVRELKVTATVPAGMRLNDARPRTRKTEGNGVTFDPVTLKPGRENALRFEVFATALKAGDVRFRVEIEAKELTGGPLKEEASTAIE